MTRWARGWSAVPGGPASGASARGSAARFLLGGAFLTYFVATVLLFFWGPWHYPVADGKTRFVVFLAAVHVAFAIGYWFGARGTARRGRLTIPVEALVIAAAAVELALLLPTTKLDTGHWIPGPWNALHNLGTVYAQSLALRETGAPYVNYVRIFVAPLLGLTVPWGIFYWRHLGVPARALFALSVLGTMTLFVSLGENAGAAHWMALFPWFVLGAHVSGERPLDRRGWVAAIAIEAISVAFFAALFTATMMERHGSFAKYGFIPGIARLSPRATPVAPPAVRKPAAPSPRPTPFRPQPAPAAATVGATGLAGYLTQGYYAVYLSLREPFVPTYGVGNSMFLTRQAARLLADPAILERPYPERIVKEGWRPLGYWATIYPWIASDVTFPGTVVVMGFIGWVAARVWIDVLARNAMAVAVLGQLLILLYYVPAHNKVMQTGEGITGFWVLLAVWAFTRRPKGEARAIS